MTAPSDRAIQRWPTLLLAILACGCGSPRVTYAPVEGVVSRNGQPLAGVSVVFFGDEGTVGPRVTGVTDNEGRYRLQKDNRQAGAPIGRHRVCLIERSTVRAPMWRAKPGTEEEPQRTDVRATPSRIPPEYGGPATTPLRAEVRPGPQTIDFQLP
jgi:hypothetical protein